MKQKRKTPLKRAIFRAVAAVLIPMLLPAGVPLAAAQPAAPPAPASPPPSNPVKVNRTRPAVTPPVLRPTFSNPPTAAELSGARVFEEPLVADRATTVEENRALGNAVLHYLDASVPGDLAPFEAFLQAHPRSAWRVGVLTNLGLTAYRTGHFSLALKYHAQAWRLGQDAKEPKTRAMAERAASEWAALLSGLGHQDDLARLLGDLKDRAFSGSSAERIETARQALWLMENRPEEAFRCGPVAVSRVLQALGYPLDERVAHAPGTRRGTSLEQVRDLAASAGVELHMGRRVNGTALPTPAVVHFKTGHFAALVERSGDRYLVADPVFDEERWLSADAVNAETSGYVLAASLPEGFTPVEQREAETVWGRSCPGPPDPTQQQPCENTSGGNCSGACGMMAGYTFLSLLAALRIKDTPLTYTPPKGPSVGFTLTYNQKDVFQPAVFSYVNVGPKWTFDAISYVEDDPSTTGLPQTVRVYRRGGGMEVFTGITNATPSAPDFRTRAVLVRVSSSPIKYERRMADGSVETFAQPSGGTAFPRKVFLTQEADPQNNKLSFIYNDSLQLEAIVDALGQVTSFAYGDPSALRITSITDPFGRTARLTYDTQGRLSSITDSVGLTSAFTYGAADFITSMTTPYGTTRFSTGVTNSRTWLEAEDPLGARERIESVRSHDPLIGPRVLPPAEVPAGFAGYNGNFDAGVTLFWDKRAMLLAPGDISKAEIKHWLESPSHRPRGILRAHKKALEGRVWYAYEGQSTSHGPDGRLIKVGRILDDPDGGGPLTAPTQAWSYTHNLAGKVCTITDPVGRQTRNTYGTGNVADAVCATGSSIDLLKVEQKNGAVWDVVKTATYNLQHLPLTMTDGALQTTTYTYTSEGKVATVTTPPRAGITEQRTTTLTYAPITGYLQSVVAPGGVTSLFTYDAYGRVRTAMNNDNDTTTYDYDGFDRPTRTTHPDGTYEETVYDRLDAARSRDRLGRWSETFHDPLRRVVATRDAAGREVHLDWCTCGSLSRLIDSNGNTTAWERDIQGRVTAETRADGSREQYTYELTTSRLRQKLDPKGQVTQYLYGLDDLPLQTQYLLEQHPTPDVTYGYADPATGQPDAYRRLRLVTDGSGTTAYTYRSFGALGAGAVQAVDGPLASDTITYGYDELGRRTSRDFGGTSAAWSYDQQGRLQSQTDAIGTFVYAYVGNTPRLDTLTYPNGQVSAYAYHGPSEDRRLQQIQHRQPGGTALNTFSYGYDDLGNIKSWSRQIDASRATVYDLEYDRVDQLTAATDKNASGTSILKRYRYAYDPAGNRTAEQIDDAVTGATHDPDMNRLLSNQPGGTLAFRGTLSEPATVEVASQPATVSASNEFAGQAPVPPQTSNVVVTAKDYSNNLRTNTYQVTASGQSRTFTYDANGNRESKTEADVTTTYEWDAEDRLLAVKQGATTLASFVYDAAGRRTQKITGGGARNYVYDDNEILEERGSVILRYVHGPGIDRHLAQYVPGGAPVYLLSDHLGSIVRQTNSAGVPTFTREYDPWGNLVTGASAGRYAYTGREWDPEIGLYYYRARYYDPKAGRFISDDPIGFDGGINFVSYVGNRPTVGVDPFGLKIYCGYHPKWGRLPGCVDFPEPEPPGWQPPPPPGGQTSNPQPPSACPSNPASKCSDCEEFLVTCKRTAAASGTAAGAACARICIVLIKAPPVAALCVIACAATGAAVKADLDRACDAGYRQCKERCK